MADTNVGLMVAHGVMVGLIVAGSGAIVTCKGGVMAIAEALIIVIMDVGFVAGSGGAIGTYEGEEIATVKDFVGLRRTRCATLLVGFLIAVTMDGMGFVQLRSSLIATALVGFLLATAKDGMGLVWLRSS